MFPEKNNDQYMYFRFNTRDLWKDLGLCLYLENYFILYKKKIYQFTDYAFLNNIWETWNQNVHTLGEIGLQGNQCRPS